MRPRTLVLTLVVAMTIALGGCGGGPLQRSVDDTTSTTVAVVTPETAIDIVTAETAPDDTGDWPVDIEEPDQGAALVVAGVDFGILDLPAGDPYDEYELVVDDSGYIEVEFPTAWSLIGTRHPWAETKEGYDYPYIGAFTDIEGFDETLPVVEVSNVPDPGSEQDLLDRMAEFDGLRSTCSEVDDFDYDDGTYTGLAELWTGCERMDGAVLLISTDVKGDYLGVAVQLATEADIDAATRVIETFSFTGD